VSFTSFGSNEEILFLCSPNRSSTRSHHFLFTVAALAPNSGLLGSNIEETALIDQWVHFAEHEVDSQTHMVLGLVKGWYPYSKPVLPFLHAFGL
jgi:hypothetical protein